MLRSVCTLLAAVLLTACGASGMPVSQGADGESGLRLTGRVDGRQIAVADGAPQQRVGDCALIVGLPADLCLVSRTIDGTRVVLGIGNPEHVAEQDGSVPVERARCGSQSECRDVTGRGVAFLLLGDASVPVDSGSLTITRYDVQEGYAGIFDLTLANGRVTGQFDVAPRSDS